MKHVSLLLALLSLLLAPSPALSPALPPALSPALSPAAGMVSQEPEPAAVYLPLLANRYTDPILYRTRIDNIAALLETCPQNDPAYAQITADFTLRLDGNVIPYNTIACTEPISAIPLENYTQALISLQTFRVAYWMDTGHPGQLSWTDKSLYQWLKGQVGGVNLKTAAGQHYCCDTFDGKKYIAQSLNDEDGRHTKRTWPGIEATLAFFAHEARHATFPYYFHVTGCPAFPNPTGTAGCDATYNPDDPGAYGVQYWLEEAWATGKLNIGLSCAADGGYAAATYHKYGTDSFRERFVAQAPPVLPELTPPYGGPCYAP